jgi:hypothetical protein
MIHPLVKQPLPEQLNLAAWQDYRGQCTNRHGYVQKGTAGLGIEGQFHDGSLLPDGFLNVCVVRNPPEGVDLDVQRWRGSAV